MTGNMILATSNDQTEVGSHHRIDRDRKGDHRRQTRITEVDQGLKHSSHRQTRTTEINHLNLEDLAREMAHLSHGRVTKDIPPKGINRIQETATESKGMPEIDQSNVRLHHNRTVDLTGSSHHHRIPRRAQWKNGKRRRRPNCMRLLTNQR
jgi:hypothetical protein